jgi:hypothetical protein
VLYAFFKRYTWHILGFINIFSDGRVLTPLCFLVIFDFYFSIPSVQIGESKFVLDIGRTSLQHQDAKPYADDLVLSMALAEVRHVWTVVVKLLSEL